MKLTLPARTSGSPLVLDTQRMVIIGANGAGKSRFADNMIHSLGPKAFKISALKALYGSPNRGSLFDLSSHYIGEEGSPEAVDIDLLYTRASQRYQLLPKAHNGFMRAVALLINEAVAGLLEERFQGLKSDKKQRLDTFIELWQQVFPENKILIKFGELMVHGAREKASDAYSANRLSDGERSVMFHLAAALLAPERSVVFVDQPEMFLHASVINPLWDRIERLRPDCTFVYVTHDLGFAASRLNCDVIWVQNYRADLSDWKYDRLPSTEGLPDEVYLAIIGERKPVLFIEGDLTNSFDAKLYPLIFPEFSVKPLGGCDRVIEATRAFNDLRSIHNLDAFGLVDRDRRNEAEVNYLRGRKILVPQVAEIENLFLLEEVVRIMAQEQHHNPSRVFERVRRNILHLFEGQLKQQALEHTRHRLKNEIAHRVDGRFDNIGAFEQHIAELMHTVNPRGVYEGLVKKFRGYVEAGDYPAVLRVFNHKSMISESHVAELCGLAGGSKHTYINAVLALLQSGCEAAEPLRQALRDAFPT